MKKIEVNNKLLQKVAKTGTAFVLAGTLLLGGSEVVFPKSFNSTKVCAETFNNLELVTLNISIGINLYLNDKGFIPTDANGAETYPFICDGTTYVPIRAIAELFHADVKWDASTNSVSITTTGEQAKLKHVPRTRNELYPTSVVAYKGAKLYINGTECIPTDANGNIKDIYIVNGTTYVPVRAISTALGLPIAWSDKTNSVFIGKHKTEGLTVENINDLEAIEEAKFQFFPYEPTHWGYIIDNRYAYNILAEGNERREFGMYIALLNWEYITDEALVAMLPNMTLSGDFYRMVKSLKIYTMGYCENDDYYNWKYIAIDEENGKFLDYVESVCCEESLTTDKTVAAKMLYDWCDESTDIYSHQKENDAVKYIMYSIMSTPRYYKDTEYYDSIKAHMTKTRQNECNYDAPYNYYCVKLAEQVEERYFKALENIKQKQLESN